jgi:hypothetical protein
MGIKMLIWTLIGTYHEHMPEMEMIMDRFEHAAARDANGRFQPGQSGNPKGKLPGTKNRATLLAEALAEGEAEALLRLVVEKAIAGDGVAARFLLGRIFAKPRGRSIRLRLPKGAQPGDVVAAFNATLAAMAAGEITPEEALIVTRVLEGRVRALEAWRVERKLTSYLGPVPGDVMFEGTDEEEEVETPLPPPLENPLPHAGEGRVRASAEHSESSDATAFAPIPSPRPSPVNGRGSDAENGRGSDVGVSGSDNGASAGPRDGVSEAALLPPNVQFACNEAALAALERQQMRRMAIRMGLLPQTRAGAEAAAP